MEPSLLSWHTALLGSQWWEQELELPSLLYKSKGFTAMILDILEEQSVFASK